MTEQTPSADSLVTESGTAPAKVAKPTHDNIDPAANIDAAAKLDPAKATPKPKRKRAAKSPAAKAKDAARRAAKREASAATQNVKAEASSAAAIAAEEHKRAKTDEGKAAYAAAVAHQVDSFADILAARAPNEALCLQLRLADGDAFVEGAMDVANGDIVPGGQGVTFNRDVDIGPDGEPVRVSEVWLVADEGAVRCAVGPLVGGNGTHARIPAGHLKF